MSADGREDSLKSHFDTELIKACELLGGLEVRMPLNSQDEFFNADTLFSTFDKFFLVEFKTEDKSLKAERRKPAACVLCTNIENNTKITALHDSCHFAMWGYREDGVLRGEYDCYRKSVCNQKVLPNCASAVKQNLKPEPIDYSFLAYGAAKNEAGIDSENFQIYLEWLLGERGEGDGGGGGGRTGDLKAAIYASSTTHKIHIEMFESRAALHKWAIGDRPTPNNSTTYIPRKRKM